MKYLSLLKSLLFAGCLLVLTNTMNNQASAYSINFEHGLTFSQPNSYEDGYVFFIPLLGNTGENGEHLAYLINDQGQVIHEWQFAHPPGPTAYLLDDGMVLFGGQTGELENPPSSGAGGTIQLVNANSSVIWEYTNPNLHHDFDIKPNGNILAMEWHPLDDSFAKQIPGGISDTEHQGKMWADRLIEIDRETKEIIWEWDVKDYLSPKDFPLPLINTRKEWTHGNSIDYLPEKNLFNGKKSILVSFRQINTIAIIEQESKEISWIWGQNILKNQHDPTYLETGNILLFDNGMHRPDNPVTPGLPYSRVIEVNPNTNEIIWEYRGGGINHTHFFSAALSGAQRLQNDNTLITEGLTGRVFEVNREGELLWEYVSPYYSKNQFNAVFKAEKHQLGENWDPQIVRTENKFNVFKWFSSLF